MLSNEIDSGIAFIVRVFGERHKLGSITSFLSAHHHTFLSEAKKKPCPFFGEKQQNFV